MSRYTASLQGIDDIEGIEGYALLNLSGAVVEKRLPATYADSFLDRLGGRVTTLWAACEETMPASKCILVRFALKKVLVQRCGWANLVIVCRESTHAATLRVAASLAGRELEALGSDPSPDVERTPTPLLSPSPAVQPPTPPKKKTKLGIWD